MEVWEIWSLKIVKIWDYSYWRSYSDHLCCDFVREVKREMCLEDMGSKIDVFFKYEEWQNEHKKSNGVVVCLVMLLRFSTGGWIKAYK